jgi:transaldolase
MFSINNPTQPQVDLSLNHGALGCTNNPSYTQKMLDHPEYSDYAYGILDEVLRKIADDRKAAIEFQARMVKPVADKFLPLFEKSGDEHGFVSIQGDLFADDITKDIADQAFYNRKISPNICCKIPVTEPAIEEMVPMKVSIKLTGIFGVSQMVTLTETYEKVARASGVFPMIYMSHIAGIYDDYLRIFVAENKIQISLSRVILH